MLRTYEQRAADAIRGMERDGVPFTFERLADAVFGSDQVGGATLVVSLLLSLRDEFRALGKFGNSGFYQSTANAVQAFRPRAALADLDGAWLLKFERFLDTSRKTNDGGKSIYLRTLRAACNRAIKDKVMPRSWYPFEGYSLAHLKTGKAKKSAGLDFVRALEAYEPADDSEALARDLFLFSFYLRGMNLADIADLTAANIQGGRVVYVRKKTGRSYSVALSDRASAIIRRYAGGVRLFPVYVDQVTDQAKHYRRKKVAKELNRALAHSFSVQALAGISFARLPASKASASSCCTCSKVSVVTLISVMVGIPFEFETVCFRTWLCIRLFWRLVFPAALAATFPPR